MTGIELEDKQWTGQPNVVSDRWTILYKMEMASLYLSPELDSETKLRGMELEVDFQFISAVQKYGDIETFCKSNHDDRFCNCVLLPL